MKIEEAKKIAKGITTDDLLNYWEGPEEPYEAIQVVLNELDKKDKVIDMMTEYIDKAYFDRERIEKWFEKNILPKDDFDLVDYKERYIRYPIIKEYFYNKIEIPEEN